MKIQNNPDYEIFDIYTYSKLISYLLNNIESITFDIIVDIYIHMKDLHTLKAISSIFFYDVEFILDIYILHFLEYEDHNYTPLYIEDVNIYDCIESFCYYVDYFTSDYFNVYLIVLDCLGANYYVKNCFVDF